MKWIYILIILTLVSCVQHDNQLSNEEIEQIKNEIIKASEKHAQDLVNKDYEEVMKFYGNVEDHVMFGDGYYWGDYSTIDGIWKDFLGDSKEMIKWDLKNHKIHVFSKEAASYLGEFENIRVESNGDTTIVSGCFTNGMKKINNRWKTVTSHVSHNYKPGYGFERYHVGYDGINREKDWWSYYSPEAMKTRD